MPCHAFLYLPVKGIVDIDGDGFGHISTDVQLLATEATTYKKQLRARKQEKRRQAITNQANVHTSVHDTVHPQPNNTFVGHESQPQCASPKPGMQTRCASLDSITKSLIRSQDTANLSKSPLYLTPDKATAVQATNSAAHRIRHGLIQ